MKYLSIIFIFVSFISNANASEHDLKTVLGCKAANNVILSAYKALDNDDMIAKSIQLKSEITSAEQKLSKALSYKQIKKVQSKSKNELYYINSVKEKDYKFNAVVKAMEPQVKDCEEYINKLKDL